MKLVKLVKVSTGLWDVYFNGVIRGRMEKVGSLVCRMDNGAVIKASNQASVIRLLEKNFK